MAAVRTFSTARPVRADRRCQIAPLYANVDRCGAEAGHLIVFDRSRARTWERKIFRRGTPPSVDAPVTVRGMS